MADKTYRELADNAKQMKRHYQNIIDMADKIGDAADLEQQVKELEGRKNILLDSQKALADSHEKEFAKAKSALQEATDAAAIKAADAKSRAETLIADAGKRAEAIIKAAQNEAETIIKPAQNTKKQLEENLVALRAENQTMETQNTAAAKELREIRNSISAAKKQMADIIKAHGLEE